MSQLKKIELEQEGYIQNLEKQLVKMHDWNRTCDDDLLETQKILENVVRKYSKLDRKLKVCYNELKLYQDDVQRDPRNSVPML